MRRGSDERLAAVDVAHLRPRASSAAHSAGMMPKNNDKNDDDKDDNNNDDDDDTFFVLANFMNRAQKQSLRLLPKLFDSYWD